MPANRSVWCTSNPIQGWVDYCRQCLRNRYEFVVCQMKISMSSDQTGETARGRVSSGDLVLKDSLRHLDDEVIE